jgi:extracellular factor (EF) 3-hydroxypalmitic acid methyl ester biosynthesis protein
MMSSLTNTASEVFPNDVSSKTLEAIRSVTSQLVALDHQTRIPLDFHAVIATMHQLCATIVRAKQESVPESAILEELRLARQIHAKSPFIRRLQEWSRGYPGDFETIEYMMKQENRCMPDTLAYWLEFVALNSPIAQQHRNKVMTQAQEMLNIVKAVTRPAKILILAAGGCPDLRLICSTLQTTPCQLVLNDSDPDALEFAMSQLGDLANRITVVQGNALVAARNLARFGPYDLVLAGGLFDYLTDQQAQFLIGVVWERLLEPGGIFFLTNIKKGNPYRVWMEYLANWHLIERSEEDLRRLVDQKGIQGELEITHDPTGLTLFMRLKRNAKSTLELER